MVVIIMGWVDDLGSWVWEGVIMVLLYEWDWKCRVGFLEIKMILDLFVMWEGLVLVLRVNFK